MSNVTFSRSIGYGIIGSILGTIAMDFIMFGIFSMMGEPPETFYIVFGNFVGGGIRIGMVIHFLTGASIGLVFGLAVSQVNVLRIETARKGVGLGILAGIVTIPLACIPAAPVLGVPVITIVSIGTIPHLVWGTILGGVAGYKLQSTAM